MEDSIKKALLDGTATIQTKIEILPNNSNEQPIILTETNGVVSWDYEDFRYVKDEGWIGQFVARQVNGVVKNISDDFSITDKEFVLHMGVKVGNNTTWYSLGNFLVNKVTDDEVNDKTSFEALDYTKKFNQTYVDSITYPCTALELAQNVCEQCGCELGNTDFKHNDWEISGNAFTNGESCREVLKAIGKLAYSWVRIGWDNKVYIDFSVETVVNEYDKINNSKYYTLSTQKEKFGAVNRVVIGYKDIEGERTKVEDAESIEANGVNEITVYDNPLVYNQELREKAIIGAEDLFGLEYMPLEMLTVGHPWLKGKELVEVTDMENKVHKTIPFDRTIQYFGHIKTKISVATNTKTNTEYAYESGIDGRIRKTEISVDKINGQITEIVKEQTETTEKLNETITTVDETKQTISKVETTVEDITTTTQTSIGGNNLYLEDALESNALEYHIDGKSEQETRSGRNLYNFEDTTNVSTNITTDNNGWITATYDNTSGSAVAFLNYYTHNLNLKTDTDYAIVLEIKSVSGTGYILPCSIYDNSGQFSSNSEYSFSNLSNNTTKIFIKTTKSSFEGSGEQGLRTFVYFNAGQSGSITFRLSVLEDTTVTADTFEYEAYGAMPSPDYPSEIKTIPSIRNLFDKDNYNLYNGYTNTNNVFVSSNNAYMIYIKCNSNTTYTISRTILENNFTVTSSVNIPSADEIATNRIVNNNGSYTSITTGNNDKYLGVYLKYVGDSDYSLKEILDSIMIEEGTIAHPYVPYGAWAKVKITGKNLLNTPYIEDNKLTHTATKNDDYFITDYYAELEANKEYIFSCKATGTFGNSGKQMQCYLMLDGNYDTYYNMDNNTTFTFTPIVSGKYYLRYDINISGETHSFWDFQIEEVTEENPGSTEYEPYQEKEVLIDLNKPNLFTGENITSGKRLLNTGEYYTDPDYFVSDYIPINTNTLYKVNYEVNAYTRMCFYDENKSFLEYNQTTNIINTSKSVYVRIGGLLSEINNIVLHEGYTDYYEICSIGDTKDTLDIVNGQVVIDKKIDEVVLDGISYKAISKSGNTNNMFNITNINNIKNPNNNSDKISIISTHFKDDYSADELYANKDLIGIAGKVGSIVAIAFGINSEITTIEQANEWLKSNNVSVYYPLAESKQIILPNVQIPLFDGVNHISLVDDLETTTSIKYYRNTPIAQDYVVQQQLDETNSNLSNTDNKVSQAQSDINATNTNLNNNYYNKNQIDSINSSTQEVITQIKNTVETTTSATNLQISILQEQLKNGVTSVKTETGYTFDKDGLKIQKTGSEMSLLLDNDGMVVKRNSTEVLTARSSGVETENLKVRTYFTIGNNTRIENYKGGTGFFHIGGSF